MKTNKVAALLLFAVFTAMPSFAQNVSREEAITVAETEASLFNPSRTHFVVDMLIHGNLCEKHNLLYISAI